MTDDTRRRYRNDPVFHSMVNALRGAIRELMLTPSEVREAAMLACVIEEERRPTKCTCVSVYGADPVRSRDTLCPFHGDSSAANIARTPGEEGRIAP